MTNSKSTKRSLFSSVMSLLLCFTMLLGTTFAWFTDSVTSANNVIKSGNLDIDVEYTLDGTKWEKLDGADDLFQKGLWEPGHTEVVALKIKNNGSLALKYTANMNIAKEVAGTNKAGEQFKLSDILTVSTLVQQVNQIGDIALDQAFKKDSYNGYENTATFKAGNVLRNDVQLLPDGEHYLIVKVDMDEEIGNEANHKGKGYEPSIEFGINVVATQLANENDSFGNQYDKDATYPAANSVNVPINTLTPTEITVGEVSVYIPAMANEGNYKLEVLDKSVEVTADGTVASYDISLYKDGAKVSGVLYPVKIEIGKFLNFKKLTHNGNDITSTATYNATTGIVSFETDSFSPFAVTYTSSPVMESKWDGTADTSWYNDADTEFKLDSAMQLAGLAELVDDGNTFEGKTIKLANNMNLYCEDDNGEPICFEPIGSYRNDMAFTGTFDGQDHIIKNMYQNTWALDNGYYYGDLGLGLFGKVEDANIKNLNMDGASISGESAIVGIVAATAYGDCTFENISVSNSKGADYQYYAGGIVGWASGNHEYVSCDVDASTTIAAQWGDFDNSTGGVIGGAGASAKINMKDCNVSCRIDAYNDVTSSYQWYAYRRCGMLIGNTGKTIVKDGTTYADAPQLTCENVTVTYGDWANYTYCEFAGKSWPYVRVQAGISNSAYSNPRYGHPTDANGKEVVDDNHVHNDGEDHQILCTFDQLYGGGQGVYGTVNHTGVTVIYNNQQ